jgi:elongation factor P
MGQISVIDAKQGVKIEIDRQPYVVVANQFVKPGKGQSFCRIKIRNLVNGRVVEKTHKTNESLELADVNESEMRMLYREADGVVFMDEESYEQITIPGDALEAVKDWLLDDHLYSVIIYRGNAIAVEPPVFMELEITETDPGARGDTASGRVLKPAITETGGKVQIPIFIEQGEKVKFDTRTGDYVSRVSSK